MSIKDNYIPKAVITSGCSGLFHSRIEFIKANIIYQDDNSLEKTGYFMS